jgi:hypothetical protein
MLLYADDPRHGESVARSSRSPVRSPGSESPTAIAGRHCRDDPDLSLPCLTAGSCSALSLRDLCELLFKASPGLRPIFEQVVAKNSEVGSAEFTGPAARLPAATATRW